LQNCEYVCICCTQKFCRWMPIGRAFFLFSFRRRKEINVCEMRKIFFDFAPLKNLSPPKTMARLLLFRRGARMWVRRELFSLPMAAEQTTVNRRQLGSQHNHSNKTHSAPANSGENNTLFPVRLFFLKIGHSFTFIDINHWKHF